MGLSYFCFVDTSSSGIVHKGCVFELSMWQKRLKFHLSKKTHSAVFRTYYVCSWFFLMRCLLPTIWL